MAKQKNHSINSEDYLRYLADQMTSKERHDFEKILLEDDFESEAFEGLSQLTSDEISSDLKMLKGELATKTRKRNSYTYWRIAASLLLLGTFSFMVYFLINSDTTLKIVQTKEAPSVEEAERKQNSRETFLDTLKIEEDRIIAYQQDLAETKNSLPEEKKQAYTPTQKPFVEEPSPVVLSEIEEELEEIQMDMGVAEPVDMPIVAMVQEEEIEVASARRKKEIVSEKALAPSAVMRKSTASNQSRMVGKDKNMRTVTGKVISQEDDEAIPGVNIIVKGTSTGTFSDSEGNYLIDIPDDEDVTLVYSSVGYISEEIAANNQETIDVNIEPDITSLSEIVVVGYGTQKKSNITESVSTIDMDENESKRFQYDPPKPVGGHGKFKDFVKENIQYPASGLEDKIKGTVKLKFTIELNGDISNMEVLKSLGEDFDNEAIRLVLEGPDWEPAIENDSTVIREIKVKIRFRVPE